MPKASAKKPFSGEPRTGGELEAEDQAQRGVDLAQLVEAEVPGRLSSRPLPPAPLRAAPARPRAQRRKKSCRSVGSLWGQPRPVPGTWASWSSGQRRPRHTTLAPSLRLGEMDLIG